MADNPSQYAWTQPVDDVSQAKYPYNNTTRTASGHILEFDDTPSAERIRLQHRTTTYTEMRANGDQVVNIVGDGYEIVVGNKNVLVKGYCSITVEGDSVLEVKGDCKQRIKGNFTQLIEGNYEQVVKGTTYVGSGGNMTVGILNGATGKLKINAGDKIVFNSDLSVSGAIRADSITSEGAISAGTGIHAGLPGSANPVAGITTTGGIRAGMPMGAPTVPGVIEAAVMVTAPSVVGSVITYGGILMDPVGGAPMMRLIYDTHTHIGNQGRPTSAPLQPMPLP